MNVSSGGKWFRIVLGKFPENLKSFEFPNAIHSTESSGNSGKKIENQMKRKFPITNIRKVWYTCIARLSFFTKNSGIYYSIRQSKFSEIQTGIFGRMESAPNLRASQLNSLFTSRLSVERLVSHLICC